MQWIYFCQSNNKCYFGIFAEDTEKFASIFWFIFGIFVAWAHFCGKIIKTWQTGNLGGFSDGCEVDL